MTSYRLPAGGKIDRSKPVHFIFDGKQVSGFQGDTIASALLGQGIQLVGRSFKYHRPRGIWGHGVEEPNAMMDVSGAVYQPNARATTTLIEEGMVVKSVNAAPTAESDRNGFLDLFARLIPAGFYYKTFMFPDWHLFEPRIRDMAGLGRVSKDGTDVGSHDQVNHFCDLLIVGAGPAGLAAAKMAAKSGQSILLCDDRLEPGGSLLVRECDIDGKPGPQWAAETVAELKAAGVTILSSTTALGIYDHGLVALNQKLGPNEPDRLWRVRPKQVILATGAIERPLPFANNDLPGVMSAEAGLAYIKNYGVAPGRDIVIATNNGLGADVARELAKNGLGVALVDYRPNAPNVDYVRCLSGVAIVKTEGKTGVKAVHLSDGTVIPADCLLVSGGYTPTVHLYCQAQGKLKWDNALLAFVPGTPLETVHVAGAMTGSFAISDVLSSASAAVNAAGLTAGNPSIATGRDLETSITAAWPKPGMPGRVWLDLQNDVTAKDVELAARENFISVEHLKRYTTLGMATDQGKTSNLPGLALMAEITGKAIPDVGTTTYRPPYSPVPLASFAGVRSGILMNPVRRLPLDTVHRQDEAYFREYGGWLRPAWYGTGDPDKTVLAEAKKARETVALFDGSSLGKIEVIGDQAAEFLDFIYYNTMSTLKPGRCRYGFILSESGIVYDDGVLVRLSENYFIVSCSSSHVAGVYGLLEEWRQDRFDKKRVFIHNATAQSATLTVTGPRSKALVEAAQLGLSLNDDHLPHMATAFSQFEGDPVRVTRVSFTGDRSYELSIRADRAEKLWAHLKSVGDPFDAFLMGLEGMSLLRAEKGYLIIGKDTDGLTRPQDLGLSQPLAKKQVEFIGRRSLINEEAMRPHRQQFIGLAVLDGGEPFATGAHGVERKGGKSRSIGYVTSSYFSPNLNRPIALGLIEGGLSRIGETIEIQHLGDIRKAKIVPACAFDPEGARLNA